MTPRYNLGYVWAVSLVAAMGGLLFGYDWVVIGGAKPFFEKSFGLTTAAEVGWANSCALVGCLIGSMFTGALSDRFGRKKLLLAAAVLFAGSSVLTGWAASAASVPMRAAWHPSFSTCAVTTSRSTRCSRPPGWRPAAVRPRS